MLGPKVVVWWSRTSGNVRERAHALLATAVSQTLGVPAGDVVVAHEPSGRPVVRTAGRALHAGISHCRDGVVAVALSDLAPVGVDVEVVRPLEWRPLARRWMLVAEAEWVAEQPASAQVEAFLRLWTYKEAVGKAYGFGLRGGGLQRPAPIHGEPPTTPWCLVAAPGDGGVCAAVGRPTGDLVLAVACASPRAAGAVAAIREVEEV